jgi:subfamily B ATP-binding cassette protein MsbA
MKEYLKLLGFIKGQKQLFMVAVVAIFFSGLLEGVQFAPAVALVDRILSKQPIVITNNVPHFVREFIDKLNTMEPANLLNIILWVILILMLVKNFFTYVSSLLMNDVSQRLIRDIRNRLYEKIQSFSLDYFSERRTGELLSRITNDVNVVENAISYGVTDLFRQTFVIITFVIIAFSIHFKAACIIFFVLPLIGWPLSRIGMKLRKLSRRTQENVADINSILLETISGVRVVKAFGTEQYEIDRFRQKNQESYKLRMKSVKRMLLMNPITEIFGLLCGIGIILWLGREVMDEKLSLGVFVLFLGSIMSIISPLKKLANVHAMAQQALAANERIYHVLDELPSVQEKLDAVELSAIQKNIKMKMCHSVMRKKGLAFWRISILRLKLANWWQLSARREQASQRW